MDQPTHDQQDNYAQRPQQQGPPPQQNRQPQHQHQQGGQAPVGDHQPQHQNYQNQSRGPPPQGGRPQHTQQSQYYQNSQRRGNSYQGRNQYQGRGGQGQYQGRGNHGYHNNQGGGRGHQGGHGGGQGYHKGQDQAHNPNKALEKEKERIKKLFVYIGDRGSNEFKKELERLSESIMGFLYKHGENSVIRNLILQELTKCIAMMAGKWKIYASFVYLIAAGSNNDYSAFVEKIFDSLMNRFSGQLGVINTFQIVNILRFLAECVNNGLFHHFSFLSILNEMTSIGNDLAPGAKDEVLVCVVKTLPFVAGTLVANCEMEFKNFVQELTRVVSSRQELRAQSLYLVDPREGGEGDQKDIIAQFWEISLFFIERKENFSALDIGFDGLVDAKKKPVRCIRKNYNVSSLEQASNKISTVGRNYCSVLDRIFGPQQEDPTNLNPGQETQNGEIKTEPQVKSEPKDPHQQGQEAPDLNQATPTLLQKYNTAVTRDIVFDLISSLRFSVAQLSAKIIYFSYDLQAVEPQSTKNYSFAIDYIFQRLLQTSTEGPDFVFNMCLSRFFFDDDFISKEYLEEIEGRLLKVFENLHELDIEAIERLCSFFCLLKNNSNLGLKWALDLPNSALDEDLALLQGFTRREILRQLIQLNMYDSCYRDESLEPIIDDLPEEPMARLECADQVNENNPVYKLIIDKFSSKVLSEGMKMFLANNEILKTYNGDLSLFFIKCLIFHTKQSFSHLIVYLERYQTIVRDYSNLGQDQQFNILNSIAEIWRTSYYHISFAVYQMYFKEIIPPTTVANWAISKLCDPESDLSANKLYNQILAKILKVASSSKARFEANAEQGSEEVIGKLQEDFVKLFQFIVNALLSNLNNVQNQAQRKLVVSRIMQLFRNFWGEVSSSVESFDKIVEESGNQDLQNRYQSFRTVATVHIQSRSA